MKVVYILDKIFSFTVTLKEKWYSSLLKIIIFGNRFRYYYFNFWKVRWAIQIGSFFQNIGILQTKLDHRKNQMKTIFEYF